MGPVEFEPGEREQMAAKLEELDRVAPQRWLDRGRSAMNRYLLDTNHLSAYLDRRALLEQKTTC